ncbi:MAG: hypothetical protein ACR2N1_17830 [Rubripirellula sp.]
MSERIGVGKAGVFWWPALTDDTSSLGNEFIELSPAIVAAKVLVRDAYGEQLSL